MPDQHILTKHHYFFFIFGLFVEIQWPRKCLFIMMIWGIFSSRVSVLGMVMQGSHPMTIPGSVDWLNYATIFKSEKNFVLPNEYWRQTYKIVLPKLPPRPNLKYDCITLPSKACLSFTSFLHQIENLDARTMVELKNTYTFLDENVPFIRISNRKKKFSYHLLVTYRNLCLGQQQWKM